MMNKKKQRQHEVLRVPQGWAGQSRDLVVQLERILDDIYNRLETVKSVLNIKPDENGNIALTKDAIKALGIPDNEGVEEQLEDLAEQQDEKLATKFPHISLAIGDKLKLTAGSRKSFIVLACGGTNASHRGAYLCYAGADSETYQVETLLAASSITVSANSSGITFTNNTVFKYYDIIDPTGTVAYTIL